MNYQARVVGTLEKEEGTYLKIFIPGEKIEEKIKKYRVDKYINSEIRIKDPREISPGQSRKLHAIIRDIAYFTVDDPKYLKQFLKYSFCVENNQEWFSTSNCSMAVARDFISYLIDFAFTYDIPTLDTLLNRTDDIDKYLWICIKHKKCAICNKPADIHHWDAVGMGRDRTSIDDSGHRKIALCREHHTEAHKIGRHTFGEKHHVYGIIFKD